MSPELDRFQYLLLMAGCIAITLPLELLLGARVYRRPLRLLRALLVTAVVFSVWDVIAIRNGLWTYSALFTTGVELPFGLPLEELVFFLAIPLCAVLTYEAVGRVLRFVGRRRGRPDSRGSRDSRDSRRRTGKEADQDA